jgi:hypothetical protein
MAKTGYQKQLWQLNVQFYFQMVSNSEFARDEVKTCR